MGLLQESPFEFSCCFQAQVRKVAAFFCFFGETRDGGRPPRLALCHRFSLVRFGVFHVCRFLELERGVDVDVLDHLASSSTQCSGQHFCIHVSDRGNVNGNSVARMFSCISFHDEPFKDAIPESCE